MRFKTGDRDTLNIFPLSINDAIRKDHPARFVVEILEQLDLSRIEAAYSETGRKPYDVKILLGIIFYGYMTRTFASRKLGEATYDSLSYQYIAAGLHPDHSTIASFKKQFLKEMDYIFAQILLIGAQMGIVKLKTVANDGSKILANASKHKALSWDYVKKLEIQVEEELALLNKMAKEAETENIPEGMNIPEELERRNDRLTVIKKVKKEIERRAEKRFAVEKAEFDEKIKQRTEWENKTGKKKGGRKPIAPTPEPKKHDQVNLTDAESRIMPKSGGGFVQAYNAHISVDITTGIILTNHVSQRTNDKLEMEPTINELHKTEILLEQKAEYILSDAGFFSENNVKLCTEANITPLIANKRNKHNRSLMGRFEHEDPNKIPEDADDVAKMNHLLNTKAGKELYALRKSTVEPVFGGLKHGMSFKQFTLRGLDAVKGELMIVCIVWNMKKLFSLGRRSSSIGKTKKAKRRDMTQHGSGEHNKLGSQEQTTMKRLDSLTKIFVTTILSLFRANTDRIYFFSQDYFLNIV